MSTPCESWAAFPTLCTKVAQLPPSVAFTN